MENENQEKEMTVVDIGVKLDGTPRKSNAGRPPKPPPPPDGVNTEPPPPPLRAPRRKKPVGEVVDPYAALKRADEEEKRAKEAKKLLIGRIKEEHPGTKVADLFDDAEQPLDEPMIPAELFASPLRTTYAMLAELLDCDTLPSEASFKAVSQSWAEASRYLGGTMTPRTLALLSAAGGTGALCMPLAIAGVEKIVKRRKGSE
jgi:hypothetical protein